MFLMNFTKNIVTWILTLTLLLFTTATANTDLKKAEAYYYGTNEVFKDYAEAKKYFLKAAEDGSPEAHRYLGAMYLYGEGVQLDKYTAKIWLEKAISLGDYKAQGFYNKYFGTPSSIVSIPKPKAKVTENTSKYKDYTPSSNTLHNAKLNFLKGKEAYEQKNYIETKEFYKNACDAGLSDVCNSLAFMYIEKLITPDYAEMVDVLKQGCEKGNALSCLLLASTYKGIYTKQSNTGKVAEVKKKGCDLLEKSTLASEIKEKKKAWSCRKSAAEKQKAARDAKRKAEQNKRYSLTVKPTPSDARVQIMNIKPKYKDGIQLKKGTYKIKVSKKGYEDKRHTLDFTKSITISVDLKKKKLNPNKIGGTLIIGDKMWQDQSINKTTEMKWNDAVSYCQNLSLGGYSDWKLPSIWTLGSLYPNRDKLKYLTLKSDIYDAWYWSSTTTTKVLQPAAKSFNFNDGNANGVWYQSGTSFTRCVRSILPSKPKKKKSLKAQKGSGKWITPSKSVCKKNGGAMHPKYGVCTAAWENANKICSESGGRLPTREKFGQVINKCGGVWPRTGPWDKIPESYSACIRKNGFVADGVAYLSTERRSTFAIQGSLAILISEMKGFETPLYESSHAVRCIKN